MAEATLRPLRAMAEVALGRQRSPEHESGPFMTPYLRAANVKDGVLDLTDVKSMNFTPTEQAVFHLKAGDVLVTEGAGSLAAVGASAVWRGELEGTVCFQNTLLRLRPRPGVDSRFLAWWSRSAYLSGLFASVATGANIFHLSADRVRTLATWFPGVSQQREIADFLDAETARIDALIEKKQRLIELLRLRLAQRAWFLVLGGAHSGNPLSASQPRARWWWSHQVPRGWRLVRLVDVVRATNGFPFDSSLFNRKGRGTRLIRIRDLISETEPTFVDGPVPTDVLVNSGDVVVGMDGDFNVVRWHGPLAALNQRLCKLQPEVGLDAGYLSYVLPFPLRYINDLTFFTTVKHLSTTDLLAQRIPLPPLGVQREITNELDQLTRQSNDLTDSLLRQIELLRERRQALITAAVTGRLDVSRAAA